jgi:hypothetical protein
MIVPEAVLLVPVSVMQVPVLSVPLPVMPVPLVPVPLLLLLFLQQLLELFYDLACHSGITYYIVFPQLFVVLIQ